MGNRIFKIFHIDITDENGLHSKSFELDKTITKIHGILFTADRDDLLYYRGSNKVEINRQEIFPEQYASKLLMSGVNVSPNDRYYNLKGIEPGNGKIKVDYKDSETTVIPFSTYRVSIYIECEISEAV